MSNDPFQSPKQKLARARKHIQEFEDASKSFAERRPYAMIAEMDSDGVTKIHKVKMTETFPSVLTDAAHDAIEGLRHTLDQLGFAAAVLNGKPDSKSSYFPFADTSSELANVIKGRCKDLPPDVISLFRSFQPYQGGNDALWAMNKVAGKKHTALVPVGTASGPVHIGKMELIAGPNSSAAIHLPRWDSRKEEMIFARIGPGSSFHGDLKFSFYVAFGDVPIFADQPVSGVLNHLTGEVSRIVSATEAECRRIGILKT